MTKERRLLTPIDQPPTLQRVRMGNYKTYFWGSDKCRNCGKRPNKSGHKLFGKYPFQDECFDALCRTCFFNKEVPKDSVPKPQISSLKSHD